MLWKFGALWRMVLGLISVPLSFFFFFNLCFSSFSPQKAGKETTGEVWDHPEPDHCLLVYSPYSGHNIDVPYPHMFTTETHNLSGKCLGCFVSPHIDKEFFFHIFP